MSAELLRVHDLSVAFGQGENETLAVDHVSFSLDRGETLAIVGEFGSGKSVSALSIPRLLNYPAARHPSGEILFNGRDLLKASRAELREVRGNEITMVFQEPMTSLNPLHTVERQIGEILALHKGIEGKKARARTLALLEEVGIRNPVSRLGAFPHQLSGGQRQRVMIAMALANEPKLLIADEPTTALDVTVQAQILALLKELQERLGMAMLFITHDLNIVRRIADRVCVMQRGRIVEAGDTAEIFARPRHAYTRMLLAAEPKGRAGPVAEDAPVVMRGEDVKVHFPIKKGLLRRTVDQVKAVDGISLKVRAGETIGVVGELGIGKDHARPRPAQARLLGGAYRLPWPRYRGDALEGAETPAQGHAGRVPGPLRLALAASVSVLDRRGRSCGAKTGHASRRASRRGGSRAERRWDRSRHHGSLPA